MIVQDLVVLSATHNANAIAWADGAQATGAQVLGIFNNVNLTAAFRAMAAPGAFPCNPIGYWGFSDWTN